PRLGRIDRVGRAHHGGRTRLGVRGPEQHLKPSRADSVVSTGTGRRAMSNTPRHHQRGAQTAEERGMVAGAGVGTKPGSGRPGLIPWTNDHRSSAYATPK